MTIIIAGHVEIDPDQRAAALEAGRPQVVGARTQSGCVAYTWTADPHDDDRVWVYEQWVDQESLARHLAGPWYRGMLEVMRSHGLRGADVAKHRVDLSEPVYDETGTPRADFVTG